VRVERGALLGRDEPTGRYGVLRIGWIDYANCTPIFTALTRHFGCDGYTFVKGVPAELNAMLAKGLIDVSPSSSIEYALHADRYCLLPGLSISSIGPVKSVLLFSRRPIEELHTCTIGLTAESATSVALLKILLAKQFGFTNRFERTGLEIRSALSRYDALLLIGDAALRESLAAEDLHVYDLGELWYRFCGLPFVFALWIVRRDACQDRGGEVRSLLQELDAAKRISRGEYGEIASLCGQLGWLGKEALVDYWHTISYDLGTEHLEGLTLFYRHAAELGILPRAPEISFVG
jgi:chorismate dehydratase